MLNVLKKIIAFENALLIKDVAFIKTFYLRYLAKPQTTSHAFCFVTLLMLITK